MVKNKLIVINKNNKNKLVKLKYSITLNIIFVADPVKISMKCNNVVFNCFEDHI